MYIHIIYTLRIFFGATSSANSQTVIYFSAPLRTARSNFISIALSSGGIFYYCTDQCHARIILYPNEAGTSRFNLESFVYGPHATFGSHSWSWYVYLSTLFAVGHKSYRIVSFPFDIFLTTSYDSQCTGTISIRQCKRFIIHKKIL